MGDRERSRGSSTAVIAATALSIFAAAAVVLGVQGVAAFHARDEEPPPPADITTTVRVDRLVDAVVADAHLVAARTWTVEGEGTVTRGGVRAGASIANGETISVIDERPVFLFTGSVPMYRDLVYGAAGDDVMQLQESLSALGYYENSVDGKYENGTARAVYDFYVDQGFDPVDTADSGVGSDQEAATIPVSELTFAPDGIAVAVTNCGDVAQKVAGQLCELQSSNSTVVVSIDGGEEERVESGQGVDVVFGSERIQGTLGGRHFSRTSRQDSAHVGEGATDAEGGHSDERRNDGIEFVVEHDQPISAIAGATGKASIVVESSEAGCLVVDAVAIREDDGGQLWLRRADDHGRVDITTGMCLRGLCVVESEGVVDGLVVVVPVPGGAKHDSDTS